MPSAHLRLIRPRDERARSYSQADESGVDNPSKYQATLAYIIYKRLHIDLSFLQQHIQWLTSSNFAVMAVRDVLKLLKFSFPFLISYGFKRLAQRISAFIHALVYKPGPSPKNVVIIGGSFAGILLARRLCESLPSGYRVVLVEKNTHFHYPFVFPRFSVVKGHEPKAFIPYDEILCSGRKGVLLGIFQRRCGTVTEVTRDSVTLATGEVIHFEFLAIATGTSSPHPSELASPDKHGACEELRVVQGQIRNAESIAVVGGGAVGVELVTDIKSWYPEKHVTLVHSRDRLLHAFGPRLHERVMEEMEKLGITVRLGQRPQIRLDGDEKTRQNATLVFPDGQADSFGLVVSSMLTNTSGNCVVNLVPDILHRPDPKHTIPGGRLVRVCLKRDGEGSGGSKPPSQLTWRPN